MTATQAKALRNGERVVFDDGVKGTVAGRIVHGIRVVWDDGQEGCIAFDDFLRIDKTEEGRTMKHASRGFTLVELLVVIGIIAILAGLLTPAVMAAMTKAHEAATVNTIRQVELGAQMFANDYGENPPSTWAQFDEVFEHDWVTRTAILDGAGNQTGWAISPGADGTYTRNTTWRGVFSNVDEVFFPWQENMAGGIPTLDPSAVDQWGNTVGVTTVNEGSEVLTACLLTQYGGAYLEMDAATLSNTDGDYDTANHVASASNWVLSPRTVNDALMEITDYWGNPLVYIRNDRYDRHDGWIGSNATGFFEQTTFPAPPGYAPEYVRYVGQDGIERPCYARSWVNFYNGVAGVPRMVGNYPNLTTFHLYSWGVDETPGAGEAVGPTGVGLGYPAASEPGLWPGFNGDSDNLANWNDD